MLIVQRYVLREVTLAFGAVFAVLVLIYVSNRFVRYLAQAASGDIGADIVLRLVFYKMLTASVLLVPLALFIAILIALGRMHRDSEVVAMTSGGIGSGRILRALFVASFGFAALAALLSLEVAPRIATLQAELVERSRGDVQLSGVIPGRFQDFSGGDQVVYAERLEAERQSLGRVFVRTRDEFQENVLMAERAYLQLSGREAARYIVLENGHRYAGNPGTLDYVVTRFERHAVLLGDSADEPVYRKLETYSTGQLMELGGPVHIAELQWRLSAPLTVLILSLMAVPLAYTSPRQGRFLHLFTAILIYFLYSNGIGVGQKLVERELLPEWLGVWLVHAFALLLTAALMLRQPDFRWWVVQRLRALTKQS